MNRTNHRNTLLFILIAAACRSAAPPTPPLTEAERAIVVVRSNREIALKIAEHCDPKGMTRAASDDALRAIAHQGGANIVEVVYEDPLNNAVLHACPADFELVAATRRQSS